MCFLAVRVSAQPDAPPPTDKEFPIGGMGFGGYGNLATMNSFMDEADFNVDGRLHQFLCPTGFTLPLSFDRTCRECTSDIHAVTQRPNASPACRYEAC